MGKSRSTFIAIGGGELAEVDSIVDKRVATLKGRPNGCVIILTAPTNEHEAAEERYTNTRTGG